MTRLLEAEGLSGGGAEGPLPGPVDLHLDAGEVLSGEQAVRERLTLATAMSAVALPVWLIHWFLAERGVRPGRPEADVERSSAVRGLYFALVREGGEWRIDDPLIGLEPMPGLDY